MNAEIIKQRLKRTLNPSGDYFGEMFRILAGSDVKLTETQKSEMITCIITYTISFLCVMFAAAAIYIASVDPKALTNRAYIYSALIIVPILLGSFLILPIFKAGASVFSFTFAILGAIVSIVVIYYFIQRMTAANTRLANFIMFVFVAILVISMLAVVYRMSIKFLKNISGWKGFIVKLLFFLPCLFLDLVEYLIQDYNNTPKIVGVIFIIQVLIVAFYFIIPYIYNRITSITRINLLDKPLYLTREYRLGNNDTLRKYEFVDNYSFMRFDKASPNGNLGDEYSKNYSISMWVYVNGNTTGKYEIPIFKYGNGVEGNGRGKPYLVYNPQNDKTPYTMYYSDFTGSKVAKYDFDMSPQKWNNVVVTYNKNRADLFLNGDLINSFTFETSAESISGAPLPIYSKYDVITVGYGHPDKKTRGVDGAICNVVYYRAPLDTTEIYSNYQLLRNKNPPL